MSDNSAFKKRIAALANAAGDKAETAVRRVVLEMGRNLVMLSPVDTGRFRGNWQFGLAAVNTDTGSAPDRSGSGSVGRMSSGLTAWRAGQMIYLTNSLPYARRLEYGWSKQAPAGMVRITLADYSAYLKKVVEGLNR